MTNKEIKEKAKENLHFCWGRQTAILYICDLVPWLTFGVGLPAAVSCEKAFYDVSQGKKVDIKDNFLYGFKNCFGEAFLANLLHSAILILGYMLLFIPGIFASLSLSMTNYLIMREPELDGDQAISMSRKMMVGNMMRMLKLVISVGWPLLVVALVSWIPLFIPLEFCLFLYYLPLMENALMLLKNEIYESYYGTPELPVYVSEEVPTVVSESVPAEEYKYCRFCGAKIPAKNKFCTQCGKPLSE